MKNARTLLTILIFSIFFFSCRVYKEKKIEKFYKKWEEDTAIINSQKLNTPIEKAVQDIIEIELCKNQAKKLQHLKKDFPKLKYQVLQDRVKVIYAKHFKKEEYGTGYYHEKNIFKDSLFQVTTKCNHNDFKLLILKDKYKRKVSGRLKYGFGSYGKKRSKASARTILENHHTSPNYHELSLKINYLIFNKALDSMMTYMASVYNEWKNLYVKKNGKWVFVKELVHISE